MGNVRVVDSFRVIKLSQSEFNHIEGPLNRFGATMGWQVALRSVGMSVDHPVAMELEATFTSFVHSMPPE